MRASTYGGVRYHDYHPAAADLCSEVLHGLGRRPRAIAPKFFYDEHGSHLFERICRLPEYYLSRTEIGIFQRYMGEIVALLGPDCVLIEPGAGSSRKVRLFLDALRPRMYLPVDICGDYLRACAEGLAMNFPWLDVHAARADYTAPLELPWLPAEVRRIAFFPGSSIGNFEPQAAVRFLAGLAALVGPGGGLLIGVDLKKDPALLHAAYNDSQGLTAEFNLNLLARINRELDADFQLPQFRHRAAYNAARGRMEMSLVSAVDQHVQLQGQCFDIGAGEAIHTENSYKYTVGEFRGVARRAGWNPRHTWTDPQHWFSVHYLDVPHG